MKIQPLNDRIIVRPDSREAATASGILLPDTAQEKPLRGTVLAVGPGKQLDNGKFTEMEVKPNDVVLYGKYSGTDIKLDGEDLVILRQDDVLAIVTGASAAKPASKEKQKAKVGR